MKRGKPAAEVSDRKSAAKAGPSKSAANAGSRKGAGGPSVKVREAPARAEESPGTAAPEKQIWRAEVYATHTDTVIDENKARERSAPLQLGWAAMVQALSETLDADITPLCDKFDGLNRGGLPTGMVHRFDEPVNAHFTYHQCCGIEPPDPVCACARSLFVLGQAARVLRQGGWRQTLRHDLVRQLATEQALENGYGRLVTQVQKVRNSQVGEREEKSKLRQAMEDLAVATQSRRLQVEDLLKMLRGPAALIGAQKSARPALMLAENELMRGSHYNSSAVAKLIVDGRNDSDPARQVRRRTALLRWRLILSLKA